VPPTNIADDTTPPLAGTGFTPPRPIVCIVQPQGEVGMHIAVSQEAPPWVSRAVSGGTRTTGVGPT